jgi:hypothetical protein
MKALIPILIGLLVVGCGKKPAEEIVAVDGEAGESVPKTSSNFLETKSRAEAGDAGAQHKLGFMYKNGQGVEQDFKEAVKWWQKAADQGDILAETYAQMLLKDHPELQQKNKDRSEAPKTFSEIDTLLRNRKGKSKSDFETVKRYLSSGVDVNRRNKSGGIILHIAAVQGDKRLVSLLLSKGAKVNAKNNIGKTPLDLAIDLKRTETIALLRKHGANTSAGLKAEGKAVKELTLREKVVGEYEFKKNGDTRRAVLLENGIVEFYRNGKKREKECKWEISKESEIHVIEDDYVGIFRINPDGSKTQIAVKPIGGKKRAVPKKIQITYKKIK